MLGLPVLPERGTAEGALEGAETGLLDAVGDSEAVMVVGSLSCICISGTSSICLAILAG